MNAKIIEGLKVVRDGIDLILAGYAEEQTPVAEEVVTTPTQEVKKSKSQQRREEIQSAKIAPETTETVESEPVAEAPEAPAEVEAPKTITREQLDGMTYNNIKKLAKEMGISAVGNREDITARILGESAEAKTEAVETPAEEAPAKKTKKTKAEPEKTEPEEVEVDEKDNDPLYAKVVETVADMSNEEIADILADIGVSAKGKREALIEKVVQAVRDGLLDFDDEDEEEEVEETPAPAPAKKEAPASVEDDEDEEDLTNDINNPDMTEARRKAIIAQDNSIRKQFKKGEVTRDNLVEFLQSFYDTEEDMDDMSDDDLLDTYIDAVCRLVDDEGDLIEEGAYTLNGEPACCGRVLVYSEDTNVFVCEHCGEEYEAE